MREPPRPSQDSELVEVHAATQFSDRLVGALRRFHLTPKGLEDFDDLGRFFRRWGYARLRRVFRRRGRASAKDFSGTVNTPLGDARQRWLSALARGIEERDSAWTASVYLVEPPSLKVSHREGFSDVIELRALNRPAMGRNRYFAITVRGHYDTTPQLRTLINSLIGHLTKAADVLAAEEDRFPRDLISKDPAVIHYLPSSGRAEFRPSLGCNHHCGFCNSVSRDSTDNSYPRKELEKLLEQLDPLGLHVIAISGGEPTLVKELPHFVELASAGGYWIELQTNGMALAERDYTRTLRKAGVTRLLISLHSASAQKSDEQITHFQGGWEKTVAGIHAALAQGFAVELSHVLHTTNFDGTLEFFEFVAREFGRKVHTRFAYVAPTGAARDEIEQFVPDMAMVVPHLRRAFAYARRKRLRVTVVGYCGIPPCLLGEGARFSSVVKHRVRYDDLRDHIRLDACKSCFYERRCPGLWKKYYERYGDPGLVSLKSRGRPKTAPPHDLNPPRPEVGC